MMTSSGSFDDDESLVRRHLSYGTYVPREDDSIISMSDDGSFVKKYDNAVFRDGVEAHERRIMSKYGTGDNGSFDLSEVGVDNKAPPPVSQDLNDSTLSLLGAYDGVLQRVSLLFTGYGRERTMADESKGSFEEQGNDGRVDSQPSYASYFTKSSYKGPGIQPPPSEPGEAEKLEEIKLDNNAVQPEGQHKIEKAGGALGWRPERIITILAAILFVGIAVTAGTYVAYKGRQNNDQPNPANNALIAGLSPAPIPVFASPPNTQISSFLPSSAPSNFPSKAQIASVRPSTLPSSAPSDFPTLLPSPAVSSSPSDVPSWSPSKSIAPTSLPTMLASDQPSSMPTTMKSSRPTGVPTTVPTKLASSSPSESLSPTRRASGNPSLSFAPTPDPTPRPTMLATFAPSAQPSVSQDTANPTRIPTRNPTVVRTENPTPQPSVRPSFFQTSQPIFTSTSTPTMAATEDTLTPTTISTSTGPASVEDIVIAASPSSAAALADPFSAQFRAATWVKAYPGYKSRRPKWKTLQLWTLAAFGYYSYSFRSWTENYGWHSRFSVCTWYGVSCDLSGRVVSIALPRNGLQRGILPEIGLLNSSLQLLDLSENALGGTIPPSIANLTQLSFLRLSYNYLTGQVPVEMTNMTKLQVFNLQGNDLYGWVPICGNDNLTEVIVDCQEVDCWCCNFCA